MAELKNAKHEKFVQNIVRGLSPTQAYISAGYSRKGAHASAARLLKNLKLGWRHTGSVRTLAGPEQIGSTEKMPTCAQPWFSD